MAPPGSQTKAAGTLCNTPSFTNAGGGEDAFASGSGNSSCFVGRRDGSPNLKWLGESKRREAMQERQLSYASEIWIEQAESDSSRFPVRKNLTPLDTAKWPEVATKIETLLPKRADRNL